TSTEMPLSEEAKRVLNNADGVSRQLGHKRVGTEHILSAIFWGSPRAKDLLAATGTPVSEPREDVEDRPSNVRTVATTQRQKEILPETRIGDLIERYPQLEDVLIAMAPAFRKLKNPILRHSVGKVASLRQAAAVGGIPVAEMVNKLRAAVGQPAWTAEGAGGD